MTSRYSRREFLKLSVETAALAGLAGRMGRMAVPLFAAEPGAGAAGAPDLAVVKGSPQYAVRRAVDVLGGIRRFVKPGDFVFLKPNMSFGTPPEMGATTNPEVVVAMAALCLEAGAKRILVADHTIRDGKVSLEYTGIGPACGKMDHVTAATLNDASQYEETPIPEGRVLKKTDLARDVRRADVLINLPVAKSHSATGVSFGIKNLMGLVWDRQVFHTGDLDQSVADLATLVRCRLTVMDATRAMVQGGPSGPGRTVALDQIVAGIDPVAVDSYTLSLTKWYNRTFSGPQVKHLRAAGEMGLGQIDLAKLSIGLDSENSGGDEDQANH